ncbi:AraC family transcriptional regulator [Bradyrhizobium iriomotense]|uniref:HTH araC/xylS-type domain-containing protein n=1 Tax=Bradyrhizobium iriomotense TaxID=441950 RepID=A0ABQ6AV01_9BRAD|nr:AraC family transcriptional regulator [Bradyrhizobium iriomotense]GLR83708.1 hypothetical protein GCM10007857_04180 [Bradyrhizobium iriomotense]
MPNRLDDLSARGFSKTLTLDAANELAHAMFGSDARVERLGQTRRVTIDFKAIHFGAAQLMRVDLAGLSVERNTDDSLHVSIPVTGGFRRGRGDNLLDYHPMRQASIGRPFDRSKLEVTDASVLVFYVPKNVAVERAERLTGRAQDADMLLSDLSEGLDLGTPVAAALARHLNVAMAEMTSLNAIGMGRLAAAASEEMLVNLVTAAMFPRVARALSVRHIDRSPAIVRRARDYIKAHADQPIEISKLAAELGVSLRSLQENFQRYLGYSPREWMLTCRLERARERLLVDDGQGSVTTAALDAGFSDLGHFSGKYRDRFGELPSQTLRRVRGIAV